MKKSPNIAKKSAPLLVFIIFIAVWEMGVRINHVPVWLLPSPSQVVKALAAISGLLLYHTEITLLEAMLGFLISIAVAFIVAFLLHDLPWLKAAIYPWLIISQTIPLIVLAVLFVTWFGWGMLPKVLIVILVCFFPITISLMNGLNSVDPDQVKLFRSMGASRRKIFAMVRLPAAMPSFFSGLRMSATYSIMAAIIGEWLGAQRGLGYFMTLEQKSFHIDNVLAAVVVICLLSYVAVRLVDLLEYIFIPWNREHYRSEIWI